MLSVPPEVNTSSLGLHHRHVAMSSRAFWIAFFAVSPGVCKDDGFPYCSAM